MNDETVTIAESGTHLACHVEVKSSVKHPVVLEGKWYGTEWEWFHPEQSCLPPSRIYPHDQQHGLMTYEAAMALAWMVMTVAQSFVEPKSFGIAVRVVESEVTYSYKAVRKKEYPNIPWRGHGNELP
jgi:hypothetical protein